LPDSSCPKNGGYGIDSGRILAILIDLISREGGAMNLFLMSLGRLAGLGGALLCASSAVARLLGAYWLGAFQVGTLLQAGIAAMVFGCFCLLLVLASRTRNSQDAKR
jgi:hypothetical protein